MRGEIDVVERAARVGDRKVSSVLGLQTIKERDSSSNSQVVMESYR
jgi:hypothetical protein